MWKAALCFYPLKRRSALAGRRRVGVGPPTDLGNGAAPVPASAPAGGGTSQAVSWLDSEGRRCARRRRRCPPAARPVPAPRPLRMASTTAARGRYCTGGERRARRRCERQRAQWWLAGGGTQMPFLSHVNSHRVRKSAGAGSYGRAGSTNFCGHTFSHLGLQHTVRRCSSHQGASGAVRRHRPSRPEE